MTCSFKICFTYFKKWIYLVEAIVSRRSLPVLYTLSFCSLLQSLFYFSAFIYSSLFYIPHFLFLFPLSYSSSYLPNSHKIYFLFHYGLLFSLTVPFTFCRFHSCVCFSPHSFRSNWIYETNRCSHEERFIIDVHMLIKSNEILHYCLPSNPTVGN